MIVVTFLSNNTKNLTSPLFKAKFGALYVNMKTKYFSEYSYNFWFVARRMIYGGAIGLLDSTPSV
jgi:hypothetical protein